MASIRKAKKLAKKQGVAYTSNRTNKELYNETRLMVDKVNKRLRNLERGGYYNSYASKKLFTRLDAKSMNVLQITRKGKKITSLKLNKSLTNTELKAIQKASRQFLTSKTSTTRRIKQVEETTKESMYKTLKVNPEMLVSKEDIEDYYDMLGNDDFSFFSNKVGASTIWNVFEDSKDAGDTENDFIKRLADYSSIIPDEDFKARARRLYDTYII